MRLVCQLQPRQHPVRIATVACFCVSHRASFHTHTLLARTAVVRKSNFFPLQSTTCSVRIGQNIRLEICSCAQIESTVLFQQKCSVSECVAAFSHCACVCVSDFIYSLPISSTCVSSLTHFQDNLIRKNNSWHRWPWNELCKSTTLKP